MEATTDPTSQTDPTSDAFEVVITDGAAIAAAATPPVRRRRRRRIVDHASQTTTLIESLLGVRGKEGARQDHIEKVILWARAVHAETAELSTLAKRPRLRKAEVSGDRQIALDVNKALLDSVLAGSIAVDVNDSGKIVFGHFPASEA